VLAGSNDGTTWMWGSKGTLMNVYAGHSAPVSAGDFTPDGTAVSACAVRCGERLLTLLLPVGRGPTPGKHIVTVSEDSSLILWDPKTANRVFRMSICTRPFLGAPCTKARPGADRPCGQDRRLSAVRCCAGV